MLALASLHWLRVQFAGDITEFFRVTHVHTIIRSSFLGRNELHTSNSDGPYRRMGGACPLRASTTQVVEVILSAAGPLDWTSASISHSRASHDVSRGIGFWRRARRSRKQN